VEALLERQRKYVTERDERHVAFDSPLWEGMFDPSWLAMAIYDRGRFWIADGFEGRRLRYDLRSLHGVVFCLFGAAMFFAFGLPDGVTSGLKLAGLAFGWLYGGNMVLAWTRIPIAIRRAIQENR
ncbi:MAG TPA: hypothetical protein VL553_03725, partial [Sphingomicrobium sp.]|nr:hypothetical protein [Sphingomicrobium sp.]